jgi:general secretion pathway protein L
MNKNRILFHNSSLQRFDWCRFDSELGKIETGHAEIEQLGRIFPSGTPVTVFIPQQMLLQTSAQMPPRANKQQLNAISYAIEDQLAEDIENCFFAVLPQQDDGSVPVAVIDQQKMDEISSLLAEYHLQVRLILPQMYLCPWSGDASVIASVCPIRQGYLIRTAEHEGFYCEASVLPQILKLVSRQSDQKDQQVICFGGVPAQLEIANVEFKAQPQMDLLTQDVVEAGCLNLKQKQYQSSHQWKASLRRWKWPLFALILLMVVFISDAVIDLWQQKNLLNTLLQQQNALLEKNLPELAGSDTPRLELTKYLADHRGGAEQMGFLDQLYEFVRLTEGLTQLKTGKIQFQKSSLIVDLESKDLKSLESLRTKLGQSSFKARIDNVNINPEKTTGRLIMEER